MANTLINRAITVTTSYVALSSSSETVNVDISCGPGNAGVVYFRDDDGSSDVPWVASEWHRIRNVDLSKIFIKGTASDIVTIVGVSGNE